MTKCSPPHYPRRKLSHTHSMHRRRGPRDRSHRRRKEAFTQSTIEIDHTLYGPTAALGDNEARFKTVHHEGLSARVRH